MQGYILPCTIVLPTPVANKQQKSDRDAVIDEELKSIPKKDREKIKFEILKLIDSYDDFFTEWNLSLPEESSETFRKQIYDIAHQEHERKMRMLKDIMKLKTKVLVAEYQQRKKSGKLPHQI